MASICVENGPEKGVITKGVFSPEESLDSLNSLESLENGWFLLCFPQSGGSLESLESLNSLESLEKGLFWKDPFSKRPLFLNPSVENGRCMDMLTCARGDVYCTARRLRSEKDGGFNLTFCLHCLEFHKDF